MAQGLTVNNSIVLFIYHLVAREVNKNLWIVCLICLSNKMIETMLYTKYFLLFMIITPLKCVLQKRNDCNKCVKRLTFSVTRNF